MKKSEHKLHIIILITLIFISLSVVLVVSFQNKIINFGNQSADLTLKTKTSISYQEIFNHRTPENKMVTKVMSTGDVMLGRTVNYKSSISNNYSWPFLEIAYFTRDADMLFINLESPLTNNCPVTNEGMIFCGDLRFGDGLEFAGVDVANIANNHAGNYGSSGLEQTIEILANKNIGVTGLGKPYVIEKNGVKFGFLGFNEFGDYFGISPATSDEVSRQVSELSSYVDVVFVQFHWGNEYTTKLTPLQISLAHLAIDSGADVVLGNHPHWIQPIEVYKNKLIVYSHGNFIFDQEWSNETKNGIVGEYYFDGAQLVDAKFSPIGIKNYGQAYLLGNELGEKVIQQLKKISEERND